jgi:DNA-binding GntR family transcriptional regulator
MTAVKGLDTMPKVSMRSPRPSALRAANNTRSIADRVYEYLRHEIVRGGIRPNERLIELDLAAKLETSRTPAREALQRLAHEGLVESKRRGWVVLEHTPEAIRGIYEIRIALEGFATRLAAQRATDAQLEAIENVYASQGLQGVVVLSRDDFVELNERFHDAIFAACGNEDLHEAIRRQARHYFSYRVARLYTEQELANAARDHRRLVQALKAHDGDTAELIEREHLQEALRITLTRFW